jgi:hypothetical protein
MFYSKQSFLEDIGAFDHNLPKTTSKKTGTKTLVDLANKTIIQYKKPISMMDFINTADKDDKRLKNTREWLEYFQTVLVENRVDILERFYNSYLYTSEIDTMFKKPLITEQLSELQDSLIDEDEKTIFIQRKDKLKRVLRNMYAKEMLNDTTITNSIPGKPNFWQSLYNLFQGKIDDRLFAPSSISLYLRDNSLQTPIYLLQQYQSKASILNPAVLYLLLHTKLDSGFKHKKIFTPEMSWSSYLLTYLMADEDWDEYIGVDVMDSVIKKSEALYKLYDERNPTSKKKMTLYKRPSESLLGDKKFMAEYSRSIDTIFYCPPYFDMEIYPDTSGNQSIDKFPTYDKWLKGYLYPTLELCSNVLKPKGKMAVIIGNYHKKLSGEQYELVDDFTSYMSKLTNMKLVDTYFLKNRLSPLKNNDKLRGEILFIFTKKMVQN